MIHAPDSDKTYSRMTYDIIIIGAGPTGLGFARSLADTGLNIVLIEKSPASIIAAPPYDGREIALTHLSHKIMNKLGMWELLPEDRVSLIKKAKVLNGNSSYALNFDYRETSKDNLGFMVSNNAIRKAAYESLDQFNNVAILTEKEVSKVSTDNQRGYVELADGQSLTAPLIVAADSRFSSSRKMMNIPTSMLDFKRSTIVCTMQAELPHDATAYECFHYDRTLAILPLQNNNVSIVITLPSDKSEEVLALNPEAFAADIMRRMDNKFGNMSLTSALFTYPLVATFAKSFTANRFAVVGDAAVGMHPVTAHGFNLGLQGGYTLANEIKSAISNGEDYAAAFVLERYSIKHRRVCAPLYHGTNALVKLYTKDTPAAKIARRGLLRLGNIIKPAKNLIMDQLTEIEVEKDARFAKNS